MNGSAYYSKMANFHRQERERAKLLGNKTEALQHEKEAANYREALKNAK